MLLQITRFHAFQIIFILFSLYWNFEYLLISVISLFIAPPHPRGEIGLKYVKLFKSNIKYAESI